MANGVTLPGAPNVGTMLGQLAMPGAQAGPIATTPYAPANVAPLWMPAEVPGKPPKIVQPKQDQFQFGGGGGGYGGALVPSGISQGSPRNTDAVGPSFQTMTPQQQQIHAQTHQKILQMLGMSPQTQPAAAAPTQPAVRPAAAQSLSQTLANMGVPAQLHPAIMQSVVNPAALGGGTPRNM